MRLNYRKGLILAILPAFLFTQCQQPASKEETSSETATEDPVARGEYLVNAMGCDDCHTPKTMTPEGPAPDMSRRFMGHPAEEPFPPAFDTTLITKNNVAVFSPGLTAAAGPWGVSFAGNLTPDETGIGTWSEEQFFRAIREGKFKGLPNGRPMLPPMPWQSYSNLNDEDLSAVFAYLKSLPPIKNVVPAPKSL